MKLFSLQYCAVVLLLVATLAASRNQDRPAEPLAAPLDTIEREIGNWKQGLDVPLDEGALQNLKPTDSICRIYRRNNKQLGLLVAYYGRQRTGETMHSPRNCLPGSGWEIWDQGHVQVEIPEWRKTFTVNRYSVHNGPSRMLVLYWYQSRKRIFANEYVGKLLLIRDALLEGATAGSLVRLTLPDEPEAEAAGMDFASLIIPRIQARLGFDRSSRP